MARDNLDRNFVRVRLAAAKLPEVDEGPWYGTPGLKVRGKGFLRMKDAGTLVLLCPIDEKEALMDAAPEIYFQTDHYKGWPSFLVRLAKIGDAELAERVTRAWKERAPAKLVAAFDGKAVRKKVSAKKSTKAVRKRE